MPAMSKRLLTMLAAIALTALGVPAAAPAATRTPPVKHVFVLMLENEGAASTFGPASKAPYLAKTLRGKGVFVPNYYGITHVSLGNYIALISGQGPSRDTQFDCGVYTPFVSTGTGADGQILGNGCAYPAGVPTLPGQLSAKRLTWKGYMEDMGNDPGREPATCGNPVLGERDKAFGATRTDAYATRHNPFAYFTALIDNGSCAKNVRPLPKLTSDLKKTSSTANYTFITPNVCHDGHDEPCVNGEPGGLTSANAFLQTWVPRVLASPAYKKDGMLVITFDEAESFGADADSSGCCNPPTYPNVTSNAALTPGPGGGRIGAVVLSRWTKGGTTSSKSYNHFSLLATVEQLFGLKKLGYAGRAGLATFGRDVFSKK